MATQSAPAATKPADLRPLLARITRDQGPEFEQSLNFAAATQVSTLTSIRTDRKIKWIDLQFRGRITNAGTGPTLRTGPSVLGANNSNVVFALFQQVTVRGQHLKYGSQTVLQMRGESCAEYLALTLPNYIPEYTVSANGGAATRFGALSTTAAQTNDIEFVLPLPMFPVNVSPSDAVMYCLHGPDWPGNLYIDVLCGDGTSIATANAPTSFTAYGATTGSPLINILTERPLLGKDYMTAIRSAITYRITFTQQPTAAVASGGGTGVKLSDLQVGKDTARIWLKTGTQASGNSAAVTTFGSLSDSIVTRTFFSLDSRGLRFQPSNGDAVLQDYSARSYGRFQPVGYKWIDFIETPGAYSPANPKAAFGSSQLTAARKYELDGDVTAASNQIAEVTQEMILGAPGITT